MKPICLLPENTRYFEFRGKPTFLLTSAEHYGSAINPDFDYIAHLDELQRNGFNQARVFSGTHIESGEDFGIVNNTLAPVGDRALCPWARSDERGYRSGGNKFDLSRWNETFWTRLKQIIQAASDRGIVIELSLFCQVYNEQMWSTSPLNPRNHIGSDGDITYREAYDPRHSKLRRAMEAMVEKYVVELNGFDNVYFEIGNEIYNRPHTRPFLAHMAALVRRVEDRLPHRHLIAINEENRTKRIDDPIPHVDIFHFHYAIPSAVYDNHSLARPIVDDETGFRGNQIELYRQEAWSFMIAGGAGFSHLDYSFTVAHPDGTHEVEKETPGIGGPVWRHQLKTLRDFLAGFEFWRMEARNELVKTLHVPRCVDVQVLAAIGEAYAVYLYGKDEGFELLLDIGRNRYQVDCIDPVSGNILHSEKVEGRDWATPIHLPDYALDLAISLKAIPRG
jgi:hypothetical protein